MMHLPLNSKQKKLNMFEKYIKLFLSILLIKINHDKLPSINLVLIFDEFNNWDTFRDNSQNTLDM